MSKKTACQRAIPTGIFLFLVSIAAAWGQQAADAGFATQGENYRIGPGDSLEIVVFEEPDLSATLPVRPDGRITMQFVEDMMASGKTPTELADDIEAVLSEVLRTDPVVTVIVQSFVGAVADQIRVIGQARQAPASVPYRRDMRVLDVVLAVGGLTEFANGNKSRIIRTVNGRTEEIRVRLRDLMEKGKIEENIPVLPGDVLSIPESFL